MIFGEYLVEDALLLLRHLTTQKKIEDLLDPKSSLGIRVFISAGILLKCMWGSKDVNLIVDLSDQQIFKLYVYI